MSKKRRKRRQRRPNIPRDTLKATTIRGEIQSEKVRQKTQDFNPDYSYVIKDLKRIGALAGIFIVLLIVISVFLR